MDTQMATSRYCERQLQKVAYALARKTTDPCSSLIIRSCQMIPILRQCWSLAEDDKFQQEATLEQKLELLYFGRVTMQTIGDAIEAQFKSGLRVGFENMVWGRSGYRDGQKAIRDGKSISSRFALFGICMDELCWTDSHEMGLDLTLDLALVMLKLCSLQETTIEMQTGDQERSMVVHRHTFPRKKIKMLAQMMAFFTLGMLGRYQLRCVFPELKDVVVLCGHQVPQNFGLHRPDKPTAGKEAIKTRAEACTLRCIDPLAGQPAFGSHSSLLEHCWKSLKLDIGNIKRLPPAAWAKAALERHAAGVQSLMMNARKSANRCRLSKCLSREHFLAISRCSLFGLKHLSDLVDDSASAFYIEPGSIALDDDFAPSSDHRPWHCKSNTGRIMMGIVPEDDVELLIDEGHLDAGRTLQEHEQLRNKGFEDPSPLGDYEIVDKPDIKSHTNAFEIRQWLILSLLDEMYRSPPETSSRFDPLAEILAMCFGEPVNFVFPDQWIHKTNRSGVNLPRLSLVGPPETLGEVWRRRDLLRYARWAVIGIAEFHAVVFGHEDVVMWGRKIQSCRSNRGHWVLQDRNVKTRKGPQANWTTSRVYPFWRG